MEHLMTLDDLYAKAIAKLGSMAEGTYDQYMEQAKGLTQKPLLVIDVKYNADMRRQGMNDQPYPIAKSEWDLFIRDAKTMAEYCPNVYVVDGSRYHAPI